VEGRWQSQLGCLQEMRLKKFRERPRSKKSQLTDIALFFKDQNLNFDSIVSNSVELTRLAGAMDDQEEVKEKHGSLT
jgi:hypothetical protein